MRINWRWMILVSCMMVLTSQPVFASVIWPSSVDWFPKKKQIVKPIELPQQGEEILLYSDDDYDYFINTGALRKIQHPYIKGQELVDVWIKVEGNANDIVYYPVNYTMQHYYMRLDQPQVQMVTSVECYSSGQTHVAVDKPYLEDAWCDIIPMSVEEACYFAIMEQLKS